MEDDNKLVQISRKDLMQLVMDSIQLSALENGGVDNWINYGDALNDDGLTDDGSFRDIEDMYDDDPNKFYEYYCEQYTVK